MDSCQGWSALDTHAMPRLNRIQGKWKTSKYTDKIELSCFLCQEIARNGGSWSGGAKGTNLTDHI